MNIIIEEIEGKNIKFATEYGSAIGVWKENFPPKKGICQVKIGIDEMIYFETVTVREDEKTIIESVDGKVLLSGKLLEYGLDGYIDVQFGDTIVQIETGYHKGFAESLDKYISFTVSGIDIYDESN